MNILISKFSYTAWPFSCHFWHFQDLMLNIFWKIVKNIVYFLTKCPSYCCVPIAACTSILSQPTTFWDVPAPPPLPRREGEGVLNTGVWNSFRRRVRVGWRTIRRQQWLALCMSGVGLARRRQITIRPGSAMMQQRICTFRVCCATCFCSNRAPEPHCTAPSSFFVTARAHSLSLSLSALLSDDTRTYRRFLRYCFRCEDDWGVNFSWTVSSVFIWLQVPRDIRFYLSNFWLNGGVEFCGFVRGLGFRTPGRVADPPQQYCDKNTFGVVNWPSGSGKIIVETPTDTILLWTVF